MDAVAASHGGNIAGALFGNLAACEVHEHIIPIVAPGSLAKHLFADESVDFVFIDGCHEVESVRRDIADWYPKVKVGGIIAGHDYQLNAHHQWPGVPQAVHEFLTEEQRHTDRFMVLPDPTVWSWIK